MGSSDSARLRMAYLYHIYGILRGVSPVSALRQRPITKLQLAASKPTTVQAMAMIAATRDSPAIRPEAIGT